MSGIDTKKESKEAEAVGDGGMDLRVECGLCGSEVRAPAELLKFAMCGCSNKARICLENEENVSHLLGGEDERKTFVQIYADGKPALPKIPLDRWNQLQQRFKSRGTLTMPY